MSTSAKIATRHKTMMTAPPAMASRLRRRRRTPSRHRLLGRTLSCASAATGLGARTPSGSTRGRGPAVTLITDPGVERAVGEVDDEIHDREEHAVGEHDRHDHRIGASRHREHEEATHAGHAKDRLDEERSRPDRREEGPQQRDHRNQRVLQRVLEDDRAPGEALGARREREVGADDLEHARAREARDDSQPPVGKSGSMNEKMMIRKTARTKLGTATPTVARETDT